MRKDPSFESPFNYAEPPYNQVNVALAIGQDWAMLTEKPNLFNSPESPAESKFNAGAVGMGMGQDWAGMFQNPFQLGNPDQMNTEQSFDGTGLPDFKQPVIGASMGQDWAMLDGNNLFDKGADVTDSASFLGIGEGKLGGTLAIKRVFCGRYCKALGYARSNDKSAFTKCVNECLIHYKEIRSKKYKIKPAPDMSADVSVDVDKVENLPNLTPSETAGAMSPTAAPGESKTGMYVLIGVIVLVVIAIIFMMMKRMRAGKSE